jgi:type I restriction enzyme M protein
MVKSMNPKTGRCAVVLPQGVLFHSGKEANIREQLIRSDKIEAVITLAGGVFYGAGVSACILFLNNKKEHTHKGRICLIDGSTIFTPARAQNYVSIENAKTMYDLYKGYEDVVDYCKVVTIADVEAGGFELSVNKYIEKTKAETLSPATVRKNYFAALAEVRAAETKMRNLLVEGGYVSE